MIQSHRTWAQISGLYVLPALFKWLGSFELWSNIEIFLTGSWFRSAKSFSKTGHNMFLYVISKNPSDPKVLSMW